jgi:5-(carboxyamino)imidazole ribonucleotide mutase
VQMIATGDENLMKKIIDYKESLKQKIVKANDELSEVKYRFKTN